eukprot:GHRR01004709.1.p1 GENE.GHRR01004709.1~~GHRR01004709.1.p1  ORF type:complete len:292 (+),score=86.10 GHRR01004709.1:583-1458(+)
MTSLQQLLEALQPRIKRLRPLVRALPQFLFDLAALLCGIRNYIMLDYAPGTTLQQLTQALEPLGQLLPGFNGCILELDGCCYIANSAKLLQHLSSLASNIGSWPYIISFSNGQAKLMQPEHCTELQQQVQLVVQCLQHQLQAPQPAYNGSYMPLIDLGRMQGLPAMPTLNGLLLNYPIVYWVRNVEEACQASRILSSSRLQLFSVRGKCMSCSTVADGWLSDGISGVLWSFTVPEHLYDEEVADSVQRFKHLVAARALNGCAGFLGVDLAVGLWQDVTMEVTVVGPGPVSL